jgi:hypothetical protein
MKTYLRFYSLKVGCFEKNSVPGSLYAQSCDSRRNQSGGGGGGRFVKTGVS